MEGWNEGGKSNGTYDLGTNIKNGELDTDDRKDLPDSAYGFPKERKEPDDRRIACAQRHGALRSGQRRRGRRSRSCLGQYQEAARHYEIEVEEESWRDMGKKPYTKKSRALTKLILRADR